MVISCGWLRTRAGAPTFRGPVDSPTAFSKVSRFLTALERINLDVPEEARKQLEAVAQRLGRAKAEVARALFLRGL